MSISGGGPRLDILNAEYEDSKKDKLERYEELRKRRIKRQQDHLKQLMSEPWGRELLWEVMVDTPVLKLNPYTRNADTYYILGLQRQATLCQKALQSLDFALYQEMEREAHNRKKREENENG